MNDTERKKEEAYRKKERKEGVMYGIPQFPIIPKTFEKNDGYSFLLVHSFLILCMFREISLSKCCCCYIFASWA